MQFPNNLYRTAIWVASITSKNQSCQNFLVEVGPIVKFIKIVWIKCCKFIANGFRGFCIRTLHKQNYPKISVKTSLVQISLTTAAIGPGRTWVGLRANSEWETFVVFATYFHPKKSGQLRLTVIIELRLRLALVDCENGGLPELCGFNFFAFYLYTFRGVFADNFPRRK